MMHVMGNACRTMRILLASGALLLFLGSPSLCNPFDPGKTASFHHASLQEAIVVHATGQRPAFKPCDAQPVHRAAVRSALLPPRYSVSPAYAAGHEILNPHYQKFLPWSSSSFT